MANYFILGMKQMGTDIFEVKDGKVTFNTDKEQIRRLWDNYYVPYMKGYFASMGKFRSDDVKTGDILAYTGSTASAMYFPDNIEGDDSSYPVDLLSVMFRSWRAVRIIRFSRVQIWLSPNQMRSMNMLPVFS